MNKTLYKSKNAILSFLKIIIFFVFFLIFTFISYHNYSFTKFFSINLGTSTSTYGALFMLFSYIYEGFKLGENKISDSVYSLNLASILSLIFTYFQLCILFNDFLNFIPILTIMSANFAWSVVSSILFSIIYSPNSIALESAFSVKKIPPGITSFINEYVAGRDIMIY